MFSLGGRTSLSVKKWLILKETNEVIEQQTDQIVSELYRGKGDGITRQCIKIRNSTKLKVTVLHDQQMARLQEVSFTCKILDANYIDWMKFCQESE